MKLEMNLPTTMRAAQAKDYGDIDQVLTVQDGVKLPKLSDPYEPVEDIHPLMRYATREDRKTHMIIKTLAVALAPGDCRVLSGKTRRFQGPPSLPYTPGGDCCGIVVETNPDETYFKVGDVVAARFSVSPRDALAEYARVSSTVCEKIPAESMTPNAAAALASASPAVALADSVRENERLLILGCGGGVGSHLCQLAKQKGAYVCGVSEAPQRLLEAPLLCDDAIDYTKEDIYASAKYQKEPFDTIIDLACGGWPRLVERSQQGIPSIVKPATAGGRFVTICPDRPTFEATKLWTLLSLFAVKPLIRTIWSRLVNRSKLPTFNNPDCLPASRDILTRTMALVTDGKLEAVVDGPYPFTTEGVRAAFRRLESRHPKGKVVIKIADL